MGTPEDALSGMLKFMGISQSENMLKMMNTLVNNAQINALKQLRRQLDINIKKLAQEGANEIASDEALDPYEILGINHDATQDDVKRAYKKKAHTAHEDHGGTNEEMVMVNAAYEAIKQYRGWK